MSRPLVLGAGPKIDDKSNEFGSKEATEWLLGSLHSETVDAEALRRYISLLTSLLSNSVVQDAIINLLTSLAVQAKSLASEGLADLKLALFVENVSLGRLMLEETGRVPPGLGECSPHPLLNMLNVLSKIDLLKQHWIVKMQMIDH